MLLEFLALVGVVLAEVPAPALAAVERGARARLGHRQQVVEVDAGVPAGVVLSVAGDPGGRGTLAQPADRLELAIVENVQRQDLNPIELALAFRELSDAGRTQDQIGEQVGLERSTIANHLRLLDLPKEAQEDVETGRLGIGHAKALLQLANPERRHWLRERILREQLSVRAAEELARELSSARPERGAKPARVKASADAIDPNLRALTQQLESHLMTRVRVHAEGRSGRIEIEFAGPEELSRLSALILEGRRL